MTLQTQLTTKNKRGMLLFQSIGKPGSNGPRKRLAGVYGNRSWLDWLGFFFAGSGGQRLDAEGAFEFVAVGRGLDGAELGFGVGQAAG